MTPVDKKDLSIALDVAHCSILPVLPDDALVSIASDSPVVSVWYDDDDTRIQIRLCVSDNPREDVQTEDHILHDGQKAGGASLATRKKVLKAVHKIRPTLPGAVGMGYVIHTDGAIYIYYHLTEEFPGKQLCMVVRSVDKRHNAFN